MNPEPWLLIIILLGAPDVIVRPTTEYPDEWPSCETAKLALHLRYKLNRIPAIVGCRRRGAYEPGHH